MYLLHEIGVEADGVDFSATSKEIAPAEVKDRIQIGSITDIALPDGQLRSGDLPRGVRTHARNQGPEGS